jgi:hypothetical protein
MDDSKGSRKNAKIFLSEPFVDSPKILPVRARNKNSGLILFETELSESALPIPGVHQNAYLQSNNVEIRYYYHKVVTRKNCYA